VRGHDVEVMREPHRGWCLETNPVAPPSLIARRNAYFVQPSLILSRSAGAIDFFDRPVIAPNPGDPAHDFLLFTSTHDAELDDHLM
jgi:hypothetical protein